jgi:hypothetical protein
MKKSVLFVLSAIALTAVPAVIVTAPARAQVVRRCPRDLIQFKVSSGLKRGPENEAKPIYRRADHLDLEGRGG